MSDAKPAPNPYGSLVIYSHSFIVQANCDRVAVTCRRLLDQYAEKKWEKVKNDRDEFINKLVIDKHYGTMFPDMRTFQFHKGQFPEFRKYLEEANIRLEDLLIEVKKSYTPNTVAYDLHEHRVLRDYQNHAKAFARGEITNGDHFSKLIGMPTGTGKALAADTEVFHITKGHLSLSELAVGDQIQVPDGTYTTVLGIYPQGIRECVKLTFKDGRQARCDKQHLWDVFVNENEESQTLTTESIAKHLGTKGDRVEIPLFNPFFYLEGTEHYLDTMEKIEAILSVRGEVAESGIRVKAKHVDDSWYLQQLFYMVGSLAHEQVEDGDIYVHISNRFVPSRMFNACKTNSCGISEADYLKTQKYLGLAIRSIEPDAVDEMICIEVDHPSNLFVLSNYIVTHNTVTSCAIASEEKTRWMVSVLPKYKDKWESDIVENLNLKPKEVMVIDSTDGLRGIIDQCKTYGTKKLQPVIIITLTTLATFFKSFQKDPAYCVEDYGCEPMDLWGILNIGTVSVDESHEHIYSVFLLAMHLHGPKFVCMSGTMLAEDPFVDRIQNVIFPMIKRYNDVKMAKYIDVEFVGYYFHQNVRGKIKYQAFGRRDYSHVELEKSIMRNKPLLSDFLDMIENFIDLGYRSRRTDNDKLLVYAATVDMVNLMVERFSGKYPDLQIRRYAKTEGDKYSNILESDATISTLQSSGTAVDIPSLITVICTTMVNSAKTNLQALGRLRDLKGKQMLMIMPFCFQLPKHTSYTEYRKELFNDRTKSMKTFTYSRHLGQNAR